MGLYYIDCPVCNKPHLWFSGNLDQRCPGCAASPIAAAPSVCIHNKYDYACDICILTNKINVLEQRVKDLEPKVGYVVE